MAVGIAPVSKRPAKTKRGPKRSHRGPDMNRMRRLEILVMSQGPGSIYLRCQQGNNI